MNKKVLSVLEFNKVISKVADYAASAPGKKKVNALLPSSNLEEVLLWQQQTADAVSRILRYGNLYLGGNRDLGASIRALEIGATLTASELLNIAGLLETAGKAKSYGRNDSETETEDTLTDYFNDLSPLSPVMNEIHRCILSEEEIADDASSTLKSIRRSMLAATDKVRSQLNSILNSNRNYLQDAVITMRGDRYCIPVKSEYKGMIPGMVHDQSSSGSTFFIEPASVVALNNELRELECKEQLEIEVILAGLSSMLGEHVTELLTDCKAMTELDFIFARASYALATKSQMPVYNNNRHLNLKKARHPLLDMKTAVPIDVRLGEDFSLLIITGPNTGGKTVSLKTVGLLALMGQSGLHIPAADRSELCLFHEVFADIGDEQSIEQSLSTFSSHMTGIVKILKQADRNSLCLFDELGAGTDPTEGAALAISILSTLHDRHVLTMATTHYSELKVYALSTPDVENACCEFDVASLRPTYRLLIGIPGKSNAFAISKKLGLPDAIIDRARLQIDSEHESFEDVVSSLEDSRKEAELMKQDLDERLLALEKKEREFRQKEQSLTEQRDRILSEARTEARYILSSAKETADETIRNIQKYGAGDIRAAEAERTRVREAMKKMDSSSSKTPQAEHKVIKPGQLKLGDSVRIISTGMSGSVHSLPDAKGNLFLMCGIIRTQTNINDIEFAEAPAVTKPKKPERTMTPTGLGKAATIHYEINLLGKTVDEALAELDKFLDDAYLSHIPSVRIVHGKGTGALRMAVQRHLKKSKYIQSFRLGEYGEGDAGVTIAEFK